MRSTRTVFLMYHELELDGRPLCQSEPGYVRYILPKRVFADQIAWLKGRGFLGQSVGQALASSSQPSVALTFDDGCETDFLCAAPILQAAGFNATFYVTTGFLGERGYLSNDQVRELDRLGFEIGCHSMSHPYLPDVDPLQLNREVVGAKQTLEELLGHPIHHFSCPGGRYNRHTLEMARKAGFLSVANSSYHSNSISTDPYHLGRVAVMREMSLHAFGELCCGSGLWKKRAAASARDTLRNLFGNTLYDRFRESILAPRNR